MLKSGSLFHILLTLLLRCYHESQATLPVQTLVGGNASFNFQLDADVNNVTVFIRYKDQVLLMRVRGNGVIYEAEYQNRTEFNGNLSTRQISFILRNITLRDAGLYTAKTNQVPYPYGEQTLIVKVSPSKPQIVEVKTPVSGVQSIFRCSTQSNSVPVNHSLIMMSEWEFKRNNQLINPGSRYSMAETNLTITGTSYEEDNDVRLTCVAFEDLNAKSEKSDEFQISVKYGPHNVQITGDPVVNEGGKLTLACSGDCNPPCINHQWHKGSQLIGSLSSLVIDNINRGHAGVYTCTVNNSAISNSSSRQITVTVNYGPDIGGVSLSPSNRSYELSELSSLTVQCSATCVPQCNYQWMGPNISQNNNVGVLSITQILRNQAGNFTCMVTNSRIPGKSVEVSLSVIVNYGPDSKDVNLSPNNTLYQLTEFSSHRVMCSAPCFPQCKFNWTGPGIIQSDDTGLLSISHILRNHSGTFTCTVSNPRIAGKSVTIGYSLIVNYPPVLTMTATNTSKGGTLVINCTASGVPNKYTFFNWTQMAPDENRTTVSELKPALLSDSEASVTIDGVTYQDSGFYMCNASNGIPNSSTGQLIMENMVFVWITDQPRITSNARYFDAEKGTSGQMHVEFYSGVVQPVVTWYRVKNSAMEPLQNSSNYKISLSVQTVEIRYHQKTVRLSGYNASLEIFTVGEEHFTSYKVEINNSYGEPVNETLELKPRGPPETPTNFNVVPESVTSYSLQLAWKAGFHGGAKQTFVIEYRENGETTWLYKSEPLGLIQHVTLNTTITDLKAGTNYEFRIYAVNEFNQSQASPTINETTEIVKKNVAKQDGSSVVIGAATGSALVLIIAVAVIGVLFYKRRQSMKSPDKDVLHEENNLSNRHGSGLKDNPVYDSSESGPVMQMDTAGVKSQRMFGQAEDPSKLYSEVDKTNKNKGKIASKGKPGKTSGAASKGKQTKTPRGDVYENTPLPLKSSAGHLASDPNSSDCVYENPEAFASRGQLVSKDGLLYAELNLGPSKTKDGKPIIHGLENRTAYADIAFGKRGEPLPESDEEKENDGSRKNNGTEMKTDE